MVVEASPDIKANSLLQQGVQGRGDYSRQDIEQLSREIASLTGQDPHTVRQWLVRKAFSTGGLKTVNIIRQLLQKDGKVPVQEPTNNAAPKPQAKSAQDLDLLLHQIFNIRSDLQKQKANLETQFAKPNQAKGILKETKTSQNISQTVSSPRSFASLLVNSRPMLVMLKSNPMAFNAALAMTNPNMKMSPALMSVFAAFVANVMKLKQGKTSATDEDEKTKFDKDQADLVEEADTKNSLVRGVKEVINQMPVKPARDFLLEAERFAEEEIANLWSITLKKEKQLEKLVTEMPEEMKNMMDAFPNLDKKKLLEKFKSLQKSRKRK